jgi:hypothetical protein
MRHPGEKGKLKITDLILAILLVVLIYAIYTTLGGNFSPSAILSASSPGANPAELITDSLHSMGEGIAKVFSSILR